MAVIWPMFSAQVGKTVPSGAPSPFQPNMAPLNLQAQPTGPQKKKWALPPTDQHLKGTFLKLGPEVPSLTSSG